MIKPFKFWAQHVLPLVYDDSLSYYEVLEKVVAKLNEVVDNENNLTVDVQDLYRAFDEYKASLNEEVDNKIQTLENFMNEYFENLDLNGEVSNIVNGMVESGEFSRILTEIVGDTAYPKFVSSVNQMTDENSVYVLTTNGMVYFYNGTEFVSSGIEYSSVAGAMLSSNLNITPSNIQTLAFNSVNDVPKNKVYAITCNGTDFISDMPDNRSNAILVDIAFSQTTDNGRLQIFSNSYQTWNRIFWGGNWTRWIATSPATEIYITPDNYESYPDYKALPSNSVYGFSANLTPEMIPDLPAYGRSSVLYKVNIDTNPESTFNGEILFFATFNGMYYQLHFSDVYGAWTPLFSTIQTVVNDNNYTNITSYDDFDDGVYFINITERVIENAPHGPHTNCVLKCYKCGEGARYQELIDISHMIRKYYRVKWGGTWGLWSSLKPNGFNLANNGAVTTYGLPSNINDYTENGIYCIGSALTSEGVSGLPIYGYNSILIVQNYDETYNNGIVQSIISANVCYVRNKYSSTWTEWKNLSDYCLNIWGASALIPLGKNDLNNFTDNGNFAISTTLTEQVLANLPEYPSAGVLHVFNVSLSANNAIMQVYQNNRGNVWYRIKYSTAWHAWIGVHTNNDSYFVHTMVDKPINVSATQKVIAVGDSITAGYNVGVANSWFNVLCTKMNWNFDNRAVNGAAFGKENVKIINQLSGVTDWDNVAAVFIAGGTNDASIETALDTYKTEIQNVIDYIKSQNNSTKIIIITPIHKDSAVQKLALYSGILANIAYANECSVINGFDVPIPSYTSTHITSFLTDGVHPSVLGDKIMANYIKYVIT